jgi:hypothetical protein
MFKKCIIIPLSVLLLLLTSCKEEPTAFAKEDIYGLWEVSTAKRNGKKTSLLRGGFFEINSDGSFITNIQGDTVRTTYAVENGVIIQHVEPVIRYTVSHLGGDTLLLKTKIRKNELELLSLKSDEK